MKFVRIFLIILAVLIAVVLAGGLLLPKTYTVSRSIVINAQDTTVYKNVSDFNNFLKWNPWSKMEPTAKINISGPAAQPGHLYTWDGKKTGKGQMLIKAVRPFSTVDIQLKFLTPFESTADTKFGLAPAKGGIQITWSMSGENKNIMEKWMGLCMDGMIGKDFENGLQNLKAISENP